jgi:hypothetical protein
MKYIMSILINNYINKGPFGLKLKFGVWCRSCAGCILLITQGALVERWLTCLLCVYRFYILSTFLLLQLVQFMFSVLVHAFEVHFISVNKLHPRNFVLWRLS